MLFSLFVVQYLTNVDQFDDESLINQNNRAMKTNPGHRFDLWNAGENQQSL